MLPSATCASARPARPHDGSGGISKISRVARSFRGGVWALVLFLGACDRPTHGGLVGDAYLAVDLGSEVDLIGLPIRLLREPHRDSTSVDSLLADICEQRDRYIAQATAQLSDSSDLARDSLQRLTRDAYDRSWRARNRILQGMIARETSADGRAHYRIEQIEPGNYRVWSDTIIDTDHWSWLEAVRISAGDSIRLNLSNDNVDSNPFRCRPRF